MGTRALPSRHRSATALAAVGVLTFEPSASVIVVAMRPLSGGVRWTFAPAAERRRMSTQRRSPNDREPEILAHYRPRTPVRDFLSRRRSAPRRRLPAEQVQQRDEDVHDRHEDAGREQ